MGFLQFTEVPDANQEKKTKTFSIQNYARTHLGYVKWPSPWRKYVFLPEDATLYDPECLLDIIKFLEAETTKQKATWK
jgi:hypothetical protein